MMEKIKKVLSIPIVQIILFAAVLVVSMSMIVFTAKTDKANNTPDMTDPRTMATISSVSSYTITNDKGQSETHYDVVIDFSVGEERYTNISLYNVPYKVDIGNELYIKYDAQHPNICSVVDDPIPQYQTFAYIFWSALGIFSLFGVVVAVRRSQLLKLREDVAKKNVSREELEQVKDGYGNYDGTASANVDAAPFSDKIDYNQIYDENRGVMDSFFDPTAPYTGYGDGDTDSTNNPF